MGKELDLVNGNGEEKVPENALENSPNSLSVAGGLAVVPAIVMSGGERSAYRFLEFFAANIRNVNTRLAYYHAVCEFFAWCEARRVRELSDIRSHHVAGYIEQLTQTYAAPSVKQHLAAIRMLFDWLVVGQIVPTNPAHAVRGPKYSATKGKTPVLLGEEARLLLDSITMDTVVGLRDRVFIALLVYSFARVSAAIGMNVEDIYVQGKRTWLRLHEKGGKRHEMPAHHELEALLDEYLATVHPASDKSAPLFYSAFGKTGLLSKNRLHRIDAYRLVKRRARAAGILSPIGCHTFRATGITQYLLNGGSLEKAQLMAAHASPRTTKLYDRTQDEVTLDEVERIMLR